MDYIIKKGEVLAVRSATGHLLRVVAGYVWLTRPDDPRDYVLGHGDTFPLDSGGLLVLEALADATVGVDCPAASCLRLTVRIDPCMPGNALQLAGHR